MKQLSPSLDGALVGFGVGRCRFVGIRGLLWVAVGSLRLSYFGKSTVAIDAKGRTNLPRELRRKLPDAAGGEVVLTIGPNRDLHLYDAKAFESVLKALRQRRPRTPELSRQIDFLTANATSNTLDDQNRISIPAEMLRYAGLSTRVTFYGAGDRIKLLHPDRAEELLRPPEELAPDLSEFLDTLEVPLEDEL